MLSGFFMEEGTIRTPYFSSHLNLKGLVVTNLAKLSLELPTLLKP